MPVIPICIISLKGESQTQFHILIRRLFFHRAIERISVTYNMEEMDQAELEDREPDLLPHFSVHNLRHTFCTRLCESTNDVKFIQQVMGHADFSTTMDIYTHITQENMQEKAKNISVNMKLM